MLLKPGKKKQKEQQVEVAETSTCCKQKKKLNLKILSEPAAEKKLKKSAT
jgi:hypothetical protein